MLVSGKEAGINALCNWEPNIQNKTIEDCIVFHKPKNDASKTESDVDYEYNDILALERTVQFIKPDKSNDRPSVRFRIPEHDNSFFNAITILSDSKTIEAFGDHDIYIDTLHGKMIEEEEGFYVYEINIDLSKKVNKEITIRFVRLSHDDHLWIYGILLKLKKLDTSKFSSICFDKVDELIKETRISEPASKCLNFMKEASLSHQSNNLENLSLSMHSVLKANAADSESSTNVQDLKNYFDYKFQVLMEYLILREKNLNDRLDVVLEYVRMQKNRQS